MPVCAPNTDTIGLLLSGGIDSAILLGQFLQSGRQVQPFYVATGCRWEYEERRALELLLAELGHPAALPLVELALPIADLYGKHWSLSGPGVPHENTPDEAVELLGRNPVLLLKPMLWCAQHKIDQLAIATLANNPFADASPRFLVPFEQALAAATGARIAVLQPFAEKSKAEILELSQDLPLHLTFSCLAPHNGLHCGACNKCAERTRALQLLPGGDPTAYAVAVNS